MIKKLLIVPAIILMSQGAFAGEGHSPRPEQQEYNEEPQPGPGYDQGYYGAPQAGPCCGVAVAPPVVVAPCCAVYPPPPPPPPPIVYNPGINYYCGMPTCGPVAVPYGPPLRPYRPVWGGGYGPRPMPYPYQRGVIAGFPGGVRRMSATGCEVQQGNNGEFSVISSEGQVLYKSNISHASENADFMKAHYEKNSDLCGGVRSPAKSWDI